MRDNQNQIGWGLSTREGSRHAKPRHALPLTSRQRMQAVADLAVFAPLFRESRAQGALTPQRDRAGRTPHSRTT